jgi:hypothetical protein
MFDSATLMLRSMQEWCVDETVNNKDHSYWTTFNAYAETLRNQMDYLAEIEYLQGLINKLSRYKNNLI